VTASANHSFGGRRGRERNQASASKPDRRAGVDVDDRLEDHRQAVAAHEPFDLGAARLAREPFLVLPAELLGELAHDAGDHLRREARAARHHPADRPDDLVAGGRFHE
jgi:hypothetical protein